MFGRLHRSFHIWFNSVRIVSVVQTTLSSVRLYNMASEINLEGYRFVHLTLIISSLGSFSIYSFTSTIIIRLLPMKGHRNWQLWVVETILTAFENLLLFRIWYDYFIVLCRIIEMTILESLGFLLKKCQELIISSLFYITSDSFDPRVLQ